MNITRNNYEAFFILYADNELAAAEGKAVEAFLAANPDLRQELEMFQQFKLSPDTSLGFGDKASLLKPVAAQTVPEEVAYESLFVLYGDNELNGTEKAMVEQAVEEHPHLRQLFESLQQARLRPDTDIVFEDKQSLLRKEKDDRVIPFAWWRWAAAAAILLMAGGLFWQSRVKKAAVNNLVQTKAVVPASRPAAKTTDEPAAAKDNKTVVPAPGTIAMDKEVKSEQSTVKSTQTPSALAVTEGRQPKKYENKRPGTEEPEQNEGNAIKNSAASNIEPVASAGRLQTEIDAKRPLVAAARQPLLDQPAVILAPDEDEKTKASFASVSNDDNIEVLNTSVNTKNPLREFLRKASRLINKKTSAGNEDGSRKTILIGGFEIAVR